MSVGDVGSNERGSGARYNDGKARVEYIPANVLAYYYSGRSGESHEKCIAVNVLFELDQLEQGNTDAINGALDYLGDHRWAGAGEQFHFGAKKYAAWNWAKGMQWSVPLACCKRHLIKVLEGESVDEESGVHHFGAVACNLIMLSHFVRHYAEGNDLPPPAAFAGTGTDANMISMHLRKNKHAFDYAPKSNGLVEGELEIGDGT